MYPDRSDLLRVQVPTLSGSDPEDDVYGEGGSFVVTSLPDPATGVVFYDGVPVTVGQVIRDYDPTKLEVDPAPGEVSVVFTYAWIDAAGVVDPTPATVTLPFNGDSTDTTSPPSPPSSTTPPSVTSLRSLAFTGGRPIEWLALAAVLFCLGGAVTLARRRLTRHRP